MSMKFKFSSAFKSASFVVCMLITILFVSGYNLFRNWHGQNTPFTMDVDQYYCYLPATFIHHDLTFQFDNNYWLIVAENGRPVPKVSMGMSYVYLPGFLIGHVIAKISGSEANGYSKPYIWSIYFCSILYALIGIWLLRGFLLRYFSEFAVALCLVSIVLGTNFIAYTVGWGEMPHNYLFVLYVLILIFMVDYHETGSLKKLLLLSFISGLIVIIRPAEILFLLIPLTYGIVDKKSFYQKLNLLASHRWHWFLVILVFFLPIIPQLIYWKYMTGQFLYFSYGSNERFFFNNPQILNFLISFKKGWLLYSPIMFFSMIGLLFIYKYAYKFKFAIPLLIVVLIYFLSSWWSWWYGGSFGNRSMIQYYSFLAIPLAAFIDTIKPLRLLKNSLLLLFSFLICLNLYQFRLYQKAHLHWDAMSKDAYFYLLKNSLTNKMDFEYYYTLLKDPDYEAAQKGEYDYKWYE